MTVPEAAPAVWMDQRGNYGTWKFRGHIYSATVDWTPLPEYEESVYEDAFSRLDAEIEID